MNAIDAEIETLKRDVSCATLLEQLPPPWTLDKRESTRHALKYRRNAGEILIVNHDRRGWWDPHSDARGDVCSLVQHLDRSLHFGHVRQVLRRFAGVAPSFPEALRSSKPTAGVAPAVRWAKRPSLRHGSAGWDYLATIRRLPAPSWPRRRGSTRCERASGVAYGSPSGRTTGSATSRSVARSSGDRSAASQIPVPVLHGTGWPSH